MPRPTSRPGPGQEALFDTTPFTKPEPQMDYSPGAWLARPDLVWHASQSPTMPQEKNEPSQSRTSFGMGFHTGTLKAAMERGRVTTPANIAAEDFHKSWKGDFIHPVRMTGKMAKSESRAGVFRDTHANMIPGEMHVLAGRNVPYENDSEDVGSISFRSPRENLHTWAESVGADPGASRHHQLLAEQFDLTIPVTKNWVNRPGPRGDFNPQTEPAVELPEQLDLFDKGNLISNATRAANGPQVTGAATRLIPMKPGFERRPTSGRRVI